MAALISLVSLALACTANAASHRAIGRRSLITDGSEVTVAGNISLAPIAVDTSTDKKDSFTPQTNVVLPYGLDTVNFVNVTLTVPAAVVLESLTSLKTVDCEEDDSVSLTFLTSEDLESAYSEWTTFDSVVLITNHLGDCDTENERGFFVASTFTVSNLTLVAGVKKTDVSTVATYLRANFTGLPGTSNNVARRDIVADPDATVLSKSWDLPDVTLYELDSYIKATANSGSLDIDLTLDGYLDFDVWKFKLDDLYVDVTAATAVDLNLELAISAAYNDTWQYTDGVTFYAVNIPGIMTFGPAVKFALGADVDIDIELDVTVDLGAEVNGSVHLDFVGDDTSYSGWEPTYHANLTFNESGSVVVAPFVSLTVELEFEILGGLLDLSGGLTPKVAFPLNGTLSAAQQVTAASGSNVTTTTTLDNSDKFCANGVSLTSDFVFTLDAFVTQFYEKELYRVDVPLASECLA